MKIEAIRLNIVESAPIVPEWQPLRTMREYPGSRSTRFGHKPYEGPALRLEPRPVYLCLLRLQTNANLETCGVLTGSWGREQVEWEAQTFKLQWETELVGAGALDREYMWLDTPRP